MITGKQVILLSSCVNIIIFVPKEYCSAFNTPYFIFIISQSEFSDLQFSLSNCNQHIFLSIRQLFAKAESFAQGLMSSFFIVHLKFL